MKEIGPEHPVTFRQDDTTWFFRCVQDRDSCVLLSAPQMGMTRFIDHLMRVDVQQCYLGDYSSSVFIIRVDSNRLEEMNRWGLCELLLATIKESCYSHPVLAKYFEEIQILHREAITTSNDILAYRNLEMAINLIVNESNIDVFFIINEFDDLYQRLDELELSNLRGIRDTNKYRINYGICLRDHPLKMRNNKFDNFTALILKRIYTLGPYSNSDAEIMILQLEKRKNKPLLKTIRDGIYTESGGHPGLISAIFECINLEDTTKNSTEQLLNNDYVNEICKKIWDYFSEDERSELQQFLSGVVLEQSKIDQLFEKRIFQKKDGKYSVFSPLIEEFIKLRFGKSPSKITLDPSRFTVTIGVNKPVELSQREYALMNLLIVANGTIVTKDQIQKVVYNEEIVSDEAISNMVRQLRNKVEPIKGKQQYIFTSHGKGFYLATELKD